MLCITRYQTDSSLHRIETSPNTRPAEDDAGQHGSGRTDIARRRALQLIGGGVVGVATMSGTASAHQFQFYGCSQVCSDSDGNRAVVATDDGYECRPMDKQDPEQASDRQNQAWSWTSACYEVADDEAIVGVLEDCSFCVNPNNCASNYYGNVGEILADLNASGSGCGGCVGTIEASTDCDVTGTGQNGGNAGGPGNDGQNGNRENGRGRRGKRRGKR